MCLSSLSLFDACVHCPGWGVLYDAYFWAAGSAFDPGGPGKAPVTLGGRVFMLGHWIFVVIIAATYTGTVGPFLTDQADIPIVRCEHSCSESICAGSVRTCLSVQSHLLITCGSLAALLSPHSSLSFRLRRGLQSLNQGKYAVVVRGPKWNSFAANSEFLGEHVGGNSEVGFLSHLFRKDVSCRICFEKTCAHIFCYAFRHAVDR